MADIKSLKAAIEAAAQRVQNDIANLRAQLAQAQAKSSISDEDQAALDDMEQTVKALDPNDPTTLADTSTPPADGGTPQGQ